MSETTQRSEGPRDQPLFDETPYGYGKDDSVSDTNERAAITHHVATIGGNEIPYAARAGHLVITGQYNSRPTAKIFYVSFTGDREDSATRPVTFFYNGGPGSSSVFLLLGSFGPRRIETGIPHFTPPAPYALKDNQECLLDQTDLVFINPVGTGYSSAIAPGKNSDFWGVDEDANSIKQFIKRYLTVYNRWNSPKVLFGESYGTPRTAVLAWLLHEDGVDLNGVVLQSSILDYSQIGNSVGLLPTLAVDALFHGKVTSPPPHDLPSFSKGVEEFALGPYQEAKTKFPKPDSKTLQRLSHILGIPPTVLEYWKLDLGTNLTAFLTGLLQEKGVALGAYDGRVTAQDTGIAQSISPDSGSNDPTITAVGGVYTAMWNVYLNGELEYTSVSPFMDLNDQAFLNWDFGHIDPTGAQKGGDQGDLYTAGDLAAAMALNPYLKVFSANGYFDAVTPYFQTILNFERMPIDKNDLHDRLTIKNYPSGHMIYLDNDSRVAMKEDFGLFFEGLMSRSVQVKELQAQDDGSRTRKTLYTRRMSRSPY